MLPLIFHACVLFVNSYTIWYDMFYVDLPLPKSFHGIPLKGRLVYMTVWCLILQTLYFFVALLNDLVGTNEPSPQKPVLIRNIRDKLFVLAFSLATSGSMAFWTLCLVDKRLVLPEEILNALPNWMNHVMHTFVAVFIVIELFLTNKTCPSRKTGYALIGGYFVTYFVWMHVVKYVTGMWPYPLLEKLNMAARPIFSTMIVLIAISMFLLAEKVISVLSTKTKKA